MTKPIGEGGGHSYTEPLNYLATALSESGLRWNEIEDRINNAASRKGGFRRLISEKLTLDLVARSQKGPNER